MKNTFMILLRKVLKYVLLEIFIMVLELLLQSLGILSVFCEDVQYITMNMCLIIFGIAITIVLAYLFNNRKNENSFRRLLKKQFHILMIAVIIVEVICVYKSSSLAQKMVVVIESYVALLILECEASTIGKYYFYDTSNLYSSYVEKPVVGREKLTGAQKNALKRLKDLIDNRNSFDSFNVALVGAWGAGKTSITNTLISEFEVENNYFILKIGTLTLRNSSNIAMYVRDYFNLLFRRYEVGISGVNVSFLSSLASLLTKSQSIEKILNSSTNNGFNDLEQEKEYFSRQVSKLLKKAGKKNVLLFIDDVDRCEDDDDIIKVLSEFASINGIISIISLDKSRDILTNTNNNQSDNKAYI